MSRFEYVVPSETTVTRLFTHDDMRKDLFDLSMAGELLITLDYDTARRYWTGKISLADLLAGEQKLDIGMVKL